jgi:radical SAM protein with 4Fe4S-binding SPASM domain
MPESGKRFTGRKEYFGSLIYDRRRGEYIPFDWDATYIFEETKKHSLNEIFTNLGGKISPQSFQTFVQLCQSIELINEEGQFVGEILPAQPVPHILSAPLRVHLSVTGTCPLKCRHCSLPPRDPSQPELSLEEMRQIMKQLAAMGTCEVVLCGGEPFYRDDLDSIVLAAREYALDVSLSTSGLFVTRNMARKISDTGLKSIKISFDGSSEKSYDYMRGKGTYRRAMRGIKILREVFGETPFKMHTVVTKPNYGELIPLLKTSQKLGLNTWSVDFVRAVGGVQPASPFLLTDIEILEAYNTILRFLESSHTNVEFYQFPSRSGKKTIYRGFGCVGGNLYAHIDNCGNMLPCSFLRGYVPSTNVRQRPLRDIWIDGEGFKAIRTLPGNELCLKCEFFKTCRGGCRARAAGRGNIAATDPVCFKLHQQAPALAEPSRL